MTSVRFCKSADGTYVSFESTGHAGYADCGEDIVCAAVSAATELVIAILENFSVNLELEIHEKKARVFCRIVSDAANSAKRESIKNVLDGYLGYLQSVSEAYPQNLKCIITEK